MQTKELSSHDIALILATESNYGLGDFFAGIKWLKSKQFKNHLQSWSGSKVLWFVSTLKSRTDIFTQIEQYKTLLPHVEIIPLIEWKGLEQYPLTEKSQAIVMFPSVHRISYKSFCHLKKTNLPILHINSLDETTQMHGLTQKRQTARAHGGFSGLGMFMESEIDLTLDKETKSVYLQDLFTEKNSTTFFSYLNKTKREIINHSNIQNFTTFAIKISDANDSINILSNLDNESVIKNLRAFFYENKFSRIELVKIKDGKLHTQTFKCNELTHHDKTLRFINIFPLSNSQILFAMVKSHSFIQVTGSESLAEIFSICRLLSPKFPFYQMNYWAEYFYEGWIKTASSIVGNKSHYITLLKLVGEKREFKIEECIDLWKKHSTSILEDSKRFCESIYYDKNRYENMLLYIDSYVELCKEFGHAALAPVSRFIEQLVVKLQDTKEIVSIATQLFHIYPLTTHSSFFYDVANLFRYSNFVVSGQDIIKLVNQFKEVKPKLYLTIAREARDLLNALPKSKQRQWLFEIIPQVAELPPSLFRSVFSDLVNEAGADLVTHHSNWIKKAIEKNKKYAIEDTFIHTPHAILLAACVLPDGMGDLAKLLSVYRMVCAKYPDLKIYFAIKHFKINLPQILEYLRSNSITMSCCFFFGERDSFPENIIYNLKLIIGVATSFPELRRYRRYKQIPYIEISENAFITYSEASTTPDDGNHEIVCMGLGEEEVGLDVSSWSKETPEEAYLNLSGSIKEKMIASVKSSKKIEKEFDLFNKEIFFMPCYMKLDHGTFSLKFPVLAANKIAKDKKSIVIWQSQLSYDLNNKTLAQWLVRNDISEVILYSKEEAKTVLKLNSGNSKSLTIITGTIPEEDYDRLYLIAKENSGFGGAVGPSSLESAIINNLIPVFFVRPHLLQTLIELDAQAEQLLGTEEYEQIHHYFQALINISNFWNAYTNLLQNPDMGPWVEEVKNFSPKIFLKNLQRLAQDKQLENMDYFYPYLSEHPEVIIQNLFEVCDFNILKSAWSRLCEHIKENHNFENWLTEKLSDYFANQNKEFEKLENLRDKASSAICYKYAIQKITLDSTPFLFSYLLKLAKQFCRPYYLGKIDFYLTDAPFMVIDTVSGFSRPSIILQREWLLTINKNHLSFLFTYLGIIIKNYPVEILMRPRLLSAQIVVENIHDEKILINGLDYIRALNTHLGEKKGTGILAHFYREDIGGTEYVYLEELKTFCTELFKIMEIKLCQLTKNKFDDFSIIGEPHDAPVITELKEFKFNIDASRIRPSVTQQDVLPELDALENELQAYRATSPVDYASLSRGGLNFLHRLRDLQSSIDESFHERLKDLVAKAYQNKISFFDNLYILVCGLINQNEELINYSFNQTSNSRSAKLSAAASKQLLFLGPFDDLYQNCNVFEDFSRRITFEIALEALKQIKNFYHENEYLFHSPDFAGIDSSIIRFNRANNRSEKEFPHISKLGRLLPWKNLFIFCGFPYRLVYPYFKSWITDKDPNNEMATLLFELGFYDESVIARLDSKILFYSKSIKLIELNSSELNERLKAIYSLLNKRGSYLNVPSVISIEIIEKFVNDYLAELSLPEKCPFHAQHLIKMLNSFHRKNPNDEKTKAFVENFFCNPYYEYGFFKITKNREKISRFAIIPSGFYSDSSRTPYFDCFLNLVKDSSFLNIVQTMSLVFPGFDLSIDYIKQKFGYQQITFEAGITIVEEISKIIANWQISSTTDFLKSIIGEIIRATAENAPFELFSREFYQYFEKCLTLLPLDEIAKFTADLFTYNQFNFLDAIYNFDFDRPISLTIGELLFIYQKFDHCLTFPDIQSRDAFTGIVEYFLETISDDDKLYSVECLLLPTSNIPLSDYEFILRLINFWSELKAKNIGLDDNSDDYYIYAKKICDDVAKKAPGLYKQLMLEQLLAKIVAQRSLSIYVGKQFQPELFKDEEIQENQFELDEVACISALYLGAEWNYRKGDALIKVASVFVKEKINRPFVTFITKQLYSGSLKEFLNEIKNITRGEKPENETEEEERKRINNAERKQEDIFDSICNIIRGEGANQDADILREAILIFIFHQFWGLPLEERAVIINALLLPAEQELLNYNVYEEAFDFIINKILPQQDEDSELALAYLKSYLKTANDNVRAFLLTAVISANQQTNGQGNLAELLPKIAEAIGVIGVKLGQATHSSDLLPPKYSKKMERLKDQSRIPSRPVLWTMVSKSLPPELFNKIKLLGPILGGASLYIAVEVTFQDNVKRVIRLLRDGVEEEIKYGIEHCRRTVMDCNHPSTIIYKTDIDQIISDAHDSCLLEINRHSVLKQYQLAEEIFYAKENINLNGKIYKIDMSSVDLYNIGGKYQIIDYADGTEFNDLKKIPRSESVCAVIAYVVVKNQLQKMISGKPFDADRHGAQVKAKIKMEGNVINIKVKHFDPGEVYSNCSPIQLEHCSNFFKLFFSQILSTGTQNFDVNKAILLLNQYIQTHANQKNDLQRLRRIRKGLLSLNDFISSLKNEPYLVNKLSKDLFQKYLLNWVTSPLQFFSKKFSIFSAKAQAHYSYDCAYTVLAAINQETLSSEWILKEGHGADLDLHSKEQEENKKAAETASELNKLFNDTLKLTEGLKDSIMWENALQVALNKLNKKIESLDYKFLNIKGTHPSTMQKYIKWKEMILSYLENYQCNLQPS